MLRCVAGLEVHIAHIWWLRLGAVVALAMLASVAGRLLFLRGEDLDHGDPVNHRLPALPGARPRSVRSGPQ